ncbi:hypothetical protein [Prosthecobacter sp.]|uniref:hypothetical protein n=1 Tax=Prosthecobacter sp. TaxID=1965333 RepID=UPI002AB8C552|nr:hypothetical protein [Prosthecobacter sp.]MDZ4405470.1 hypothetical protein [Prosthecobacter sp.]
MARCFFTDEAPKVGVRSFGQIDTQEAIEGIAKVALDVEVDEAGVHAEVMADERWDAALGAIGGADGVAQGFDGVAPVRGGSIAPAPGMSA